MHNITNVSFKRFSLMPERREKMHCGKNYCSVRQSFLKRLAQNTAFLLALTWNMNGHNSMIR